MSALPSLERRSRLFGGRYPSFIALTDSCADPATSPRLRLWLRSRSLRRLPSAPAAHGTFSTLFCESFLRCLSPCPGGPAECTCLVLPQRHRPSPNEKWVGFPLMSRERDFSRTLFRGCSYSFMFRPPSLFASRVAPTAASSVAGQLRRLHPSRTCIVTFARIGYAIRPTTGNWRSEDFHLARFTALSTAPLNLRVHSIRAWCVTHGPVVVTEEYGFDPHRPYQPSF
jgi:hypothetical protein